MRKEGLVPTLKDLDKLFETDSESSDADMVCPWFYVIVRSYDLYPIICCIIYHICVNGIIFFINNISIFSGVFRNFIDDWFS